MASIGYEGTFELNEFNEPMRLCSDSEIRTAKQLMINNKWAKVIYLMNTKAEKLKDEQKEEVIKKATLNGWRDFSFCNNQNKSQGKFRLDQNVITDTAARNESLKEFRLKQQQGGTEGVDYY